MPVYTVPHSRSTRRHAETSGDIIQNGGRAVDLTTNAIPVSAANVTTMDCAKGNTFTYTPTEATTITPINLAEGQDITIIFLTVGTTSYVVTFGAPFKTTGTLTSGAVAAKYFIVRFRSDGTNVYEIARTTAM